MFSCNRPISSFAWYSPPYVIGNIRLPSSGRTTRGIFRINGGSSVVSALYNHYCTLAGDGEVVTGTVICPKLPTDIKCDVHDVASAFKKFLFGLPGGILGSMSLFCALSTIQSQLGANPEMTRTKQTKVRARLIALGILTLKSQYRHVLLSPGL